MPELNGVEVTRAVRKFNTTIPILLSGAASDADERVALESGAQVYLKKPTGIETLVDEIKRLIGE